MLMDGALTTCDSSGEARAVVALWLAGQATDHTRRSLAEQSATAMGPVVVDLLKRENYDTTIPPVLPQFGTLSTGDDVQSALRLLALSDDRVAEVVRTHWTELVEPSTPVSRVFELLDEPVPESARTTRTVDGGIIPPTGRCADLPERSAAAS